ncbi:molybdate ABC transporter substrate-binding protein [Adlercreutzia sp. R21]|uniref:molybdate ABC transporter substrate-binding protein n=1 Tax=Adlercreutzia wanghongyangiae TaxID=3111451 RepID=UPI002DB8F854|nr:molybdate ABC transporter substrate-binding protein [Adlercreutzia sp. R21]MEC4184991.1 molybdate ABC transporter substrate-binding protein [Adlercreutzia sp. R21]
MAGVWKRSAIAVVLAVMVALGLFGCASGETSESATDVTGQEEPNGTATGEGEQPSGEPVELQIFAANSLTKAMAEAEELYTRQNPNVTFADTQYEGSGALIEMLAAGQYADVLITASRGTMDDAVDKSYAREDTRQTMFNNDLVIVTKQGGELAGTDITLEEIAQGKYTLAVGDESVPAGNYACQALSTVGAYIEPDNATGADATGKGGEFSDVIKDKVTLGAKVGDVCKYAETGEVDIAMVYTSDVYRMGGVEICSVVPNDTHKAIVYPGAVCAGSEHAEEAQAFLTWCMTDEDCAQIWEKWGFELAQD